MDTSALLRTIITNQDVERLVEELVLVEEHLTRSDQDRDSDRLAEEVREELYQIYGQLRESGMDLGEKLTVLRQIKDKLQTMDKVEVVLAFRPSKRFLEKLYQDIRTNAGEMVLIELKYDPSIIAGAVISFGGTIWDGSIKEVFDVRSKELGEKIKRDLNHESV